MSGPERGSPEFWAASKPDEPAVVHRDAGLTYGDWNARADRVAEGLAAAGLRAGDRLGMRFRLGFEWFVIQRALQKLGVVQVAVNWRLTPAEAAYILRDSDSVGLACDDPDPSEWTTQALKVLVTVGQPEGAPGLRYEDLVETEGATPRFGPLGPMMVLYTSGTTGAPRGVPPIDRSTIDPTRLMRYNASLGRMPHVPRGAVVLLTLPIHHGGGPAAAAGVCAVGGTAVLLDPFDAEEALRLIERHRVQIWTTVPTMLLRIQALPEEVQARYDLSSILAISAGAAPIPQSLKAWLIGRLGDGVFWEGYGISEVGGVTFAAPADHLLKPGTSGRPFDEVDVIIVDDQWNRLPPGVTGEIAVNTPMVLTGYLGREPLGEDILKDGYYRSGDVGHLDEDGYLFITDRIKDMIVAGGVNIYPAEIEKVLVEHPGVINAAVIGIPHDDFGEQPLAFILADPASRPTADELLRFLDGRLASYKRPRAFEFVDELPLSPMGKVLKTELRAPYWEGRDRHV